jgi:ATP-dependent helicase/nuclease subunit B
MDVGHEVRYITRRVQVLLDEKDIPPDDIGIVVTDTGTYLEQFQQAATDRNLPVKMTREYDLDTTRPGRALFDLLDLLDTPADGAVLADLLRNPIVSLEGYDTDIDALSLATEAEESEIGGADEPSRPDDADQVFTEIETRANTVADADTIDAFLEFAAAFGLSRQSLEGRTNRMEEAWAVIEHTIDAVEARPELGPRVEWRPALRRALGSATVTLTTGPEAGSIDVRKITDTAETTYRHVFIAGLTESQYPSGGRRLAFTRRLNEAHPDFDRSQPASRADHRVATLLGAADTATLTRPRLQLDSTEYIAAGVLTELMNHTEIEATAIDEYGHLVDDVAKQEVIGATTDTWRAPIQEPSPTTATSSSRTQTRRNPTRGVTWSSHTCSTTNASCQVFMGTRTGLQRHWPTNIDVRAPRFSHSIRSSSLKNRPRLTIRRSRRRLR